MMCLEKGGKSSCWDRAGGAHVRNRIREGGEPPISGSGRSHGQPRPRLEGVGCVLPQHESATVALSGSCSHPSEGLAGVVYPQSSVAVLKHNGNLTKNPVALVVARFYVSFVEENGRIFYSQ